MISEIYGSTNSASALAAVYSNAARRSGSSSFAQTLSAATSVSGNAATRQADGIYHAKSLAGQSLPLSEAPDYSTWDKEEAYCDIVKRYNLLNMLTSEQASAMGLGEAYTQMKDEMNDVLYGGNPMTICSNVDETKALDSDIPQRMNRKVYCEMYGITSDEEYERLFKQDIMSMYDIENGGTSDAFQIFNTLSDFDLTDQKTNLTRTVSGMVRGDASLAASGAGDNMSISDYLNYREVFALLQYRYGTMSESAYSNSIGWNDFVRGLYNL